jgi:AcrR family transcriptional regulator
MMDSSPRERRHEKTRQAILDAARKIIATEGTEALSMRAIAQRIDYSPAGLYEYFDSKEEIIGAVCQQGHRRLTEYMQRADPDLPPPDLLLQLGLAYVDFAVRNPDFFLLMFTNPNTGVAPDSTPGQAAADMQQEGSSFQLLLRAIQRGVDEGVFKAKSGYGVFEMAFTAWAMVHGIAMLRIGHLRNYPGDIDAMGLEALRRIGAGLMADLA